jgi:BNR repeat-like domain
LPRRSFVAILASVLMIAVAAASARSTAVPAATIATVTAPSPTEAEQEGRGGDAEAAEQLRDTQERLDALREARAAGTFGARISGGSFTSAPGWAGEAVLNPTKDDWEPAIAADPRAPYVYVVATRYAAKPCKGNCPSPWMALAISKDGGATWGTQRPLCACKGSGQYDPIIEVVPDTGAVYAVYMNGYNVVFIRSTDHGRTWTAPVTTYGKVAWNDKPVMAMSDDGHDVYVSWNGPKGGDPWVAQSHDGGQTWTQTRLASSDLYFFAYDADVTSDGRVLLAEAGLDYANSVELDGPTQMHTFVSDDRGATWTDVVVDEFPPSIACADCRADYYAGHVALSSDARGRLAIAYDAPVADHGFQRIYVRRSSDGGLTWSGRTALSQDGEHATAPMLESRGNGDVRLVYYQTATGGNLDRWNVWYRASRDGGRSWTDPVKISDRGNGASYKHPAGFGEVYGDYGEMGITSSGAAIAAWGEGPSYIGPGGVWINRQV